MHFVTRHAWYLGSIAAGLAAIVVEVVAKRALAAGVGAIARATHDLHHGVASEVVATAKEQAIAHVHQGTSLAAVGFSLAVASAVCFFFSRVRSERGPRIVPLVIWTVYFAFFLVAV
jgi:hypothetical protein